MQGKILMNDKFKNPVDCLMYILSELDDDKKRLREFCDAIVDDMSSNNFIIVHKDKLEHIIETTVKKHIQSNMDKNKSFPSGAYFLG